MPGYSPISTSFIDASRGSSSASSSSITSGAVPVPAQMSNSNSNSNSSYGQTHSRNQSTASSNVGCSSLSASQSGYVFGQQQQQASPPLAAPTLISYGSRNVRARVDREVPIDEIIRQLCASPQLSIQEPPALFCLRDASNNDLLTQGNIAAKLAAGVSLKLVSAPVIEAVDMVERLLGSDAVQVKQAVFSLRGFVREDAFVNEFLNRRGVAALAAVIQSTSGNTLAYALSAMQSLLDLDEGWEDLNQGFVQKIVSIISGQTLVNIVRPALAILRRLVASDHPSFGFNAIWPVLSPSDNFFKALAYQITREGDKLLTGAALALLNGIMKSITAEYSLEAIERLEAFKYRKAVISLIENHAEDVTPHILQFQQNCANVWHTQQSTPVLLTDPAADGGGAQPRHLTMLQAVYTYSGLLSRHQSQPPDNTSASSDVHLDYKKLGLSQSNLDTIEKHDFSSTGLLGLYTLHHIASHHTKDFSKLVLEQVNRPDARRCPIALVSLQVTQILSEQFDLSGSLASSSFQPFLLDLFRVHLIVLEFFVRLFAESGATPADIARVSTLVRSQVRVSLARGGLDYHRADGADSSAEAKTFYMLKEEFESAKYDDIRDRQMKELEIEDDLMSTLPVRNLRDRLYRESFEFVRSQRISCLLQGAWFTVPSAKTQNLSASQRGKGALNYAIAAKYRFCRLASNQRHLHFLETDQAGAAITIRPGVDDLPGKIDLSSVAEVLSGQTPSNSSNGPSPSAMGGGRSSGNLVRAPSSATLGTSKSPSMSGNGSLLNSVRSPRSITSAPVSAGVLSASPASTNPLAIILLSSEGSTTAELVAPSASAHSEWLDGLNCLLPDGQGVISTKETADFVQILTDVGVKIKLLDLSGERLEIPAALPVPMVPPPNVPFHYAE